MTYKEVFFNEEARSKLKKGVDTLANAVKVTLGPRGRNVIIQKPGSMPHITKDGVTVAREINLEDSVEDMGAQMVKEVASKTNSLAGDGTTTATVLAQSMFTEGLKSIANGSNPIDLKRGMDKAVKHVVSNLKLITEAIDDEAKILDIATISANNEQEVGQLVFDAINSVGTNGVVTVDENKTSQTVINKVDGMSFPRGYESPHFITDKQSQKCILENPYILLCEDKILEINHILRLLESISQEGKPLLLIASDIGGVVMATLIQNHLRGVIQTCVVGAPNYADRRKQVMEDIACLTDGYVIAESKGMHIKDTQLAHLGKADRIVVTRDDCTIVVNDRNTRVLDRIEEIKAQIGSEEFGYDTDKLHERLAKLSGGVAVISVGGANTVEIREKRDRIEDALNATRAALDEGIVSGGGVAYIRASTGLNKLSVLNSDEARGIEIVRTALEMPLRIIVDNAGLESSAVLDRVKRNKRNHGFNAKTEKFENLIDAGVIDPVKVSRIALENAVSIASLLLTTEVTIITNFNNAGHQQIPQA